MSRDEPKLQDITLDTIGETMLAWQVRDCDGTQAWLPKSRCENNHDGTYTVEKWMLEEKGLNYALD